MDLLRRIDPVPDRVRVAGHAARLVAGGPALLRLVSEREPAPDSGLRTGRARRQWEFDGPSAGVTVQLTESRDGTWELVGLVSPSPAGITARTPVGASATVSDPLGWFRLAGVHPGPVSLVVHVPGADPVATPWLVV
nr:hypothetical protein GCM10020241_40580 [Streptoalloteichus tenebrarius]